MKDNIDILIIIALCIFIAKATVELIFLLAKFTACGLSCSPAIMTL